jgi:putative CocE/NonD family hydrolase
VAIVAALALAARASESDVRARYTKHDYEIPMRDGVRLFTSVYVPKDRGRSYPIMLQRTPYGVAPYGVDAYEDALGPSPRFEQDGFIFVYQDVRGRYLSGGDWMEMRPHRAARRASGDVDESTDAYDTIAWLLDHVRGHNGKVGMWGISYPGFYVAAALPGAHPALVAASPQAPIADLFMGDDAFHNGAFMLAANFGFYASFRPRPGGPALPGETPRFAYGTPDGYEFFLGLGGLAEGTRRFIGADNPYWLANLEHTTYDAFWQSRSILPHLSGIVPHVLTVGGWFDAEDLAGPLAVYRAIERTKPTGSNRLVMGPWAHGGWAGGDGDRLGNLSFAVKTAADYRNEIEFPFFAHHLKGTPLPESAAAEATVFVTGRNEWQRHVVWPPAEATPKTFYFGAGQRLAERPPPDGAGTEAADEYVSDPNRPVPYLGYVASGMRRDYMTEDQRFAATRPDVLVYATPPLDADLTVAGPITVTLHVTTTGTDADFVVKVVDAYPGTYPSPAPSGGTTGQAPPANAVRMGGYQQLVRGEPFRGKFRESFERPVPFVPGQPARIRFVMPDVAHTFRRGHRLMVQVQSSWFPLIDRNPQKFMDIPKATAADFVRQTHRVLRSPERPSSIEVLAVP